MYSESLVLREDNSSNSTNLRRHEQNKHALYWRQLCSVHKSSLITATTSPREKQDQWHGISQEHVAARGRVRSYLFSRALIFSSFSWTAWLSFLVSDSSSSKVSTLLKITKKSQNFQDVFTFLKIINECLEAKKNTEYQRTPTFLPKMLFSPLLSSDCASVYDCEPGHLPTCFRKIMQLKYNVMSQKADEANIVELP